MAKRVEQLLVKNTGAARARSNVVVDVCRKNVILFFPNHLTLVLPTPRARATSPTDFIPSVLLFRAVNG